jgi:hypothetical protein
MTYSIVLLLVAILVCASTSSQNSPSFSVSKPAPINSHIRDGIVANKLLALNVGGSTGTAGSVVQSQQLQPYPYKDEDFLIPIMKDQPRYIQRYLNPQATHQIPPISTLSPNWIVIALSVLSFSKALYLKLMTNSTVNTNSVQRTTVIGNDDDDKNNDYNNAFEKASAEGDNKEGDTDVVSSTTDTHAGESSTISPEWKEQYDHLLVEATSLREQLSTIQQMLEKQQAESLEATISSSKIIDGDNSDSPTTSDNVGEIAAMVAEIQSLKESVQYWKRVAEMNEQQISNIVQVERQNGVQQLELMKTEMLEMVDTERNAMMKEFTNMIQELRDSLKSQ